MFKQLKVNKSSRYRRRKRVESQAKLIFSSSSSDDDSIEIGPSSNFQKHSQSQFNVPSIVSTPYKSNFINELDQESNNIIDQELFNESDLSLDSSSSF